MNGDPDDYLRLNNRHHGETVYIIGAGPQLARLDQRTILELESRVTIGLNRTTYKLQPTYFLSAYIGHVLLAQMRASRTVFLHMRPVFEPPLAPGILPLRRRVFEEGQRLHRVFSPPEPVLLTRRNAALAATHLALILGAAEVVYVGVEQQNALHYFNYEPDTLALMRRDIERVPNVSLNVDHPDFTIERLIAAVEAVPAEMEQRPFYSENHVNSFRTYFELLRQYGVRVVTTVEGVAADAGAERADLAAYIS